jgi:hypothetical protein
VRGYWLSATDVADGLPRKRDTGCGKHATAAKINAMKHLLFLVGYFPQSVFIFFHLDRILCSISPIVGDISTNQLMVGKNIR